MLSQFFSHFFRAETDGFVFHAFSPLHFLFIFLTILLLMGIIAAKDHMDAHPRMARCIEISLGLALLGAQVLYYLWYLMSGTYDISESLPLYTCRVASIIGPMALFTKNRVLKLISIYWGFYAFFALTTPVLDQYSFPHLTNFIFWGVHIGLVCMCAILSFWGEGYDFNNADLKFMLIFMIIYLGISYPIDMGLQGNYHFFIKSPIAPELFSKLPPLANFAVVTSIYLVVTLFTCFVGRSVRVLLSNVQSRLETRNV